MSETSEAGLGGETTPVNPYNLLDAVNAASRDAHLGWLIFLAVVTYLWVVVSGVTHWDLLTAAPITLPFLQIKVPLTGFFEAAPVLLVLCHLALITQLTLLARKAVEFDAALRLLELTDRRTHPLRLELHNFFFTQSLAGPERSWIISAFLSAIAWLTLAALPVLLLLFFQSTFLPFHSVPITWIHRVALLSDMVLLCLLGAFLVRRETSFVVAFARNAISRPLTFLVSVVLLVLVSLTSLFVATIPGEVMDRDAVRLTQLPAGAEGQAYISGFMVPAVLARVDGGVRGVFLRNIDVRDVGRTFDNVGPQVGALNLRHRDLRGARLDRADLRKADFAGAALTGATFVGSNLHGASFGCIGGASDTPAGCVVARGADFRRAELGESILSGADFSGARFDGARMTSADLSRTTLIGASLRGAQLERALLNGGIRAEGADFAAASLTGADLTGARLAASNFEGAALQGASLAQTGLEGARLREADLEAAALTQAALYGADLTGARVTNADFHGAIVWQSIAPSVDSAGLADFTDLALRPIDDKATASLKEAVERIDEERVRARVRQFVAAVLDPGEAKKWGNGNELGRWQAAVQASQAVVASGYKGRLAEALVKSMCKPRWSAGHLAFGIAKRAQSSQFRGDAVAIYERLRAEDCPASKSLPAGVMKELAVVADQLRGE